MFALVGTGESSSALTDPWEERDSLPKWLSNHLDVSNFLASSSSSKSNGFLVNTSLRAGKFSPGKPGRANEFVFPKVLFIYLSKKKKEDTGMLVETSGSHGHGRRRCPISYSFSLGRLRDVAHFTGDPFATRDIIDHVLVPLF